MTHSIKNVLLVALVLAIAMPNLLPQGGEVQGEEAFTAMKDLGMDDDWQVWGDEDTVDMGASMASGDLDGDGREDLAVGISETLSGGTSGSVQVYFSRDPDDLYPVWGSQDADLIVYGIDPDDHFGYALAIADLDGDGRGELIIGAPFADGPADGRRDCGEVYILGGRSRSAYGVAIDIGSEGLFGHLIGRDPSDHLGMGIEVADLNGDGVQDIVIRSEGAGGAPSSENNNPGSWEVEVIEGNLSGIGYHDIYQKTSMIRFYGSLTSSGPLSNQAASHIGNGLATGDLNGDGHDDIAFTFRTPTEGFVCIYLGGTDFPPDVQDGTVIVPEHHDMIIELGEDGHDRAPLDMGDVDGDGKDDLLVGIPGSTGFDPWRKGAGQVDLYMGRSFTGQVSLTRDDANWTVLGEDSSDGMGSTLLMIDRDGDGKDEVFVGTPASDGKFNVHDKSGEGFGFRVNLSSGRYHNLSEAYYSAQGDGSGWGSFTNMECIDMDGDGTEDLLIASPGAMYEGEWTSRGMVTLLLGKPIWDARFVGRQDLSRFGGTSLISDIDEDGYVDLMISATRAGEGVEGEVYLYFGSEEGFSGYYYAENDPDITFISEWDGQKLGGSLAVGDLNDDGRKDILIGSPLWGYSGGSGGVVWFFWGDTKENMTAGSTVDLTISEYPTIRGEKTTEAATSLCVGDFNGDGKDDLAIGAPKKSSNNLHHNGHVFIFYGPIAFSGNMLRTNDADVEIQGTMQGEELGAALTKGDIDGDSIDDLVIGAPRSSPGSIKGAGSVYVLKGGPSLAPTIDLSTDMRTRIDGEWPFDAMGYSVHCDDIDHDGLSDIIMGAPKADGDQRSTQEAGAVYMLYGKFLGPGLSNQTLRIREGVNLSVYGSTISEQLGFSLTTGDIDGDGLEDIVMGAKDSINPNIGKRTGRVFIMYTISEIEGLKMISSSLPYLATQDEGDGLGYSLSCSDIDNDMKADLLIGAPGHDPDNKESPRGASFLWLSKQMFYNEYKAGEAVILNGHSVVEGTRSMAYVCPGEGPYIFRMNARSLVGYSAVENLTLALRMDDGSGSAEIRYNVQTDSFYASMAGVMTDKVVLDESASRAWHEGLDMYYSDFALWLDWGMVGPDQVITRVDTALGSHVNYRSETFRIDNGINYREGSITFENTGGWLSTDHLFTLRGMTIEHTATGKRFSTDNLENISFRLNRPDGISIKNSTIESGRHLFHNVSVGTGISGRNLRFWIIPGTLPSGSVWDGNLSFTLDVDTKAPSMISSFKVYPDGRMENFGNMDDDVQVEIWWDDQVDFGDSGIATTMLEIRHSNGTAYDILRDVEAGDFIVLQEGDMELYLWSVDNAGNIGPSSRWDILVDLSGPVFYNFTPGEGEWVSDRSAEFSVDVKDGISGIEGSTAKYRTYGSGSSELTTWKYVYGVLEAKEGKRLIVQPDMPEGRGHYIQWSISDMVGRVSVSGASYFNVDLTPPSINLMGGSDVEYVKKEAITFSCEIQDPLSGLSFDSIEYRFGHAHGFHDLPWVSMDQTGTGAAAYPSVDLAPSFAGYGYIQWRAADIAGNPAESALGTIYVDENLPVFSSFLPNSSIPQKSRKVTVSVAVMEDESGIDIDGMEMAVSTVSGWINYGVGGYSPWTRVESMDEVDLGMFQATATVTLDEGPFNLIKFRVKDRAGNGWVESKPQKVEVEIYRENLPPDVVMQLIPRSDFIQQGEFITLDGSSSSDPEGVDLTYRWYSDMEGYPGEKLLGTEARIEVELTRIGVHHLWLEISDGEHRVESEPVLLQVMEPPGNEEDPTSGGEKGLGDYLVELIPIMILLVVIGILIGALIGAFLMRSRKHEGPVLVAPGEEGFPEVETDWVNPVCPYCDAEVRLTDDYCMACGNLFTNDDMKKIKDSMTKKSSKKKKVSDEVPTGPDVTELPEGEDVLIMEEPPEVGEVLDMEEPPYEEDIPDIEDEMEEFEELEELEDLEGWDEDDLDWEGDI